MASLAEESRPELGGEGSRHLKRCLSNISLKSHYTHTRVKHMRENDSVEVGVGAAKAWKGFCCSFSTRETTYSTVLPV